MLSHTKEEKKKKNYETKIEPLTSGMSKSTGNMKDLAKN